MALSNKRLALLAFVLCCCGGMLGLNYSSFITGQEKDSSLQIRWDKSLVKFPLSRNVQLTWLNKTIHPHNLRQVPSGLIEIYAEEGLFEYDGNDLSPALIQKNIEQKVICAAMAADSVWYFGTSDNYLIIKGKSERVISQLPIDSTFEIKSITTSGVSVIICGENSILLFDTEKKTFKKIALPSGNEIYGMVKDNDEKIWMATDAGIYVFRAMRYDLMLFKHFDQSNYIPDNLTTSIDFDGNETITVGTYESGIYTINTKTFKVKGYELDIHGQIDNILCISSDKIVATVQNEGIFLIDLTSASLELLYNIPSGKRIMDITLIDEGWISAVTEDGDMIMINPIFGEIDLGISGLQCVRQVEGSLMIGTSKGLYRYGLDRKVNLIKETSGLNIVSLFTDLNGTLWIGTYGQGLYKLNDEGIQRVELLQKIDQNIMSIDGNKENIYLATLSGAYSIGLNVDKNSTIKWVKNHRNQGNIGAQFIYSVKIMEDGSVWFGIDGKGLWKLENEILVPYSKTSANSKRSIQSIYPFGKDFLLNVDGHELYFVKSDEKFKKENRILFNTSNISGIIGVENIWTAVYSENRIVLINNESSKSVLYDKLFENEVFTPTLNSGAIMSDGSAILCTDNYLIQISNTELIKRVKPLTVIHSVSSGVDHPDRLRAKFDASENTIDINYSGIWYNDPARISFKYRLENYESQFKNTLDRHVFYTNLPPGHYNFDIETICGSVDSIPNSISYSFDIAKPYYATWWFRISAILLISTLLYLTFANIERNRRKKQQLESEKLEAQISILKSQINPHFLFNSFNTLTALIDEDPVNASLYVEKLSAFYRALLTLNSDVHTVEVELNILNDFYFLLKQRFGDNLDLVIDITDKRSLVPPLTFQLLFENVINHNVVSRTKPMKVSITQNKNLAIVFSNIKHKKPSDSSGTGIGLQNIRNRYKLMFGKEIIVRDLEDRFEVELPYAEK